MHACTHTHAHTRIRTRMHMHTHAHTRTSAQIWAGGPSTLESEAEGRLLNSRPAWAASLSCRPGCSTEGDLASKPLTVFGAERGKDDPQLCGFRAEMNNGEE